MMGRKNKDFKQFIQSRKWILKQEKNRRRRVGVSLYYAQRPYYDRAASFRKVEKERKEDYT